MMSGCVAEVADWRPGQVVDVDVAMHRLTTTVALRMLFGALATAAVVAEAHALLPPMMRGLYRRAMIPFAPLHAVPTPENRRYLTARRRLHAVVDTLLAQPSTEDTGDTAVDVLRAGGLAGRELRDEVLGLLVGGVETTVATLCWTFVLLDEHDEVRERLHAEVDAVLDSGAPATHADLERLPHTGRVVTEVLRLYPPVWVLTRQVTEDTELAGHPVPAGATVMFSPYAQHRDPRLFPAPDEFDPDRWLPDRAVPQGAWIPFGAGNRKCVGDVFATVEATLAVATIARRWRLTATGPRPKPVPRGELGTGRLRMTARPR
jgi:pentalenene oxygenase